MIDKKNISAQFKKVELIVSDVDGVLTDGTITISSSGDESKTFCVEDGTGVALARYANLPLAFLRVTFKPLALLILSLLPILTHFFLPLDFVPGGQISFFIFFLFRMTNLNPASFISID